MRLHYGVVSGLLLVAFGLGACTSQPSPPTEADWITLIDGETGLENWDHVGNANWRAEDGAIVADLKTVESNAFLVSPDAYTDFELRVEFWAIAETNSGVFIRCSDPTEIGAATAYEINIWDTRPDPVYGTGGIVNVAERSSPVTAGGQWNTFEISAQGDHLTVTMNGVQTVDVHDSRFVSGPIALQYATEVVKFRSVEIRPL
jgi:hypothetical protein